MAQNSEKRMPSSSVNNKNIPNPIDVRVGSRIRLRRMLLGISQEKLASALGLTFQQVQKYERGTNRVGASRLFHLSQILQVPVNFFFEDLSENLSGNQDEPLTSANLDNDNNAKTNQEKKLSFYENIQDMKENIYRYVNSKETLDLLIHYYRIKDETSRHIILNFIKSMSEKL